MFFVILPANSSKKTCPGFVQITLKSLWMLQLKISIPGNVSSQITIFIYKVRHIELSIPFQFVHIDVQDPLTNNWWLQYNEKTNIE